MFEIIGALTFLGLGLSIMYWVFHVVETNYKNNNMDWGDWFIGVILLTIGLLLVYYGAEYFISHLEWTKG